MNEQQCFLFLSPEVSRFLTDNEITIEELIRRTGKPIEVEVASNPAGSAIGQKEPATILLATAAVIAAATPVLREIIRVLSGRDAIVRERRLLPVMDNEGKVLTNTSGEPILHWVDVVKEMPVKGSSSTKIGGLGIEISFEDTK